MNAASTNEDRPAGPAPPPRAAYPVEPTPGQVDPPEQDEWYRPKHGVNEVADALGADALRTDLLGSLDADTSGEPEEAGVPEAGRFDSYDGPLDGSATWASDEASPDAGSLVRPYTKTGGRTRPDYNLAIESLVSTRTGGPTLDATASEEQRSICVLCEETRSVAEVAAHLRLPLGVVKVLIGDLAVMGLLQIHSNDMTAGGRPTVEFMERVLSGLQRL